MNNKYFDGVIQAPNTPEEVDEELKAVALAMPGKVEAKMNELKVADAIDEIFVLLRRANKYIDETAPWVLAKDESKKGRLATVIYNLLETIRVGAVLLTPYIPKTSANILSQLGTDKSDRASIESFGALEAGKPLGEAFTLFARIDEKKG